ncbi:MAG TPA: LysR family transcriptional regulator [Methylophaga aminisulfidivorans]|uniref:LysR family transcriptional regulator n=2 Tax=root TaxID=1 RepID=A0A7C1VPY9_9GAMM|nr:LysR family transcriptional regulator [Methylophaga aminisulfidivorans]
MNTLDAMHTFLQVVQSGSFTRAAEKLESSGANVSRAVSALEKHLGTRLLHRTTRQIALTEAGKRYVIRCEEILSSVDEAEAEARHAQITPVGRLRIHVMPALANHYIVKAIAAYRQLYPMVSFEMTLANRIPDLIEEGFDVSIVMAHQLPDSSLISKPIGQTYSVLCASPDYLEQHGIPTEPKQLEQHECLSMQSTVLPLDYWELESDFDQHIVNLTHSPFTVNVGSTLREAIINSLGIGMIPLFSVHDDLHEGRLVRVLPDYRAKTFTVHALYPSKTYIDAKTTTWITFLSEYLPQRLAEDTTMLSVK